jgi:hypothetical protein
MLKNGARVYEKYSGSARNSLFAPADTFADGTGDGLTRHSATPAPEGSRMRQWQHEF